MATSFIRTVRQKQSEKGIGPTVVKLFLLLMNDRNMFDDVQCWKIFTRQSQVT